MSLLSMDPGAEAADETIYFPSRHLETDRAFIADFMDEYSLTNVPTLFTRSANGRGKIWFQLAKNNRRNEALDGLSETLVVFHGLHGYISPNWYANSASVHASGKAQRLDDDGVFATNLSKLVAGNEGKYAADHGTSPNCRTPT